MRKWLKLGAALGLLFALTAQAVPQTVQQSGTVTANSVSRWVSNGVIGGGVTASDSPITSFGVTSNSSAGICVSSGRSTAAGRQQLCLGAPLGSAGIISLQNYGTATAQDLTFRINGTDVTLPTGGGTFLTGTGTFVAGNLVKFFNTSGVVQDAGVSLATGTQYGLPYYSTTTALTSTGAGTNGQVLVGQTSSVPLWKTFSGDVGSLSATGALTLQSVNGVTFNSSYTAHGVLLGNGTSAFTSTTTSNTGYCLLSQGLSSDPIWAACASGSGSAGGSNTQVQFNSSTSLGGSANLTWVSPALTIGVAGTTTGQLALASSTATGTVTLQSPGVSGTYNFNFPTGAGTSGQPLISGGGGSTPNTFGTLGIFGGGTNCAAASGTCLDNITSFSSTGYLNRTGSGTYAFSSVIPVSGGGTNLASGTSGGILGYTASGTLASSALLAQNGVVIGGGAGATPTAIAACTNGQIVVGVTSAAPACQTLSGDITTVSSAGLVTIANSAITVAKMANAAGYSLFGNFTASSAAPQVSTIGGLTQKASPAGTDLLLVQDQAAAGQLKYATVSSVASAGSVASLNSQTGALTFTAGLQNSTTTFSWDGQYAGYDYANCSLAAGVSGNALTISLKDAAGNDPSATSPCIINFRNATIATGTVSTVYVTSALSFVTGNNGSTFGSLSSNVPFRLWITAINNAGTVVLGVSNQSTATAVFPLNEGAVQSSTACNACTTATSAGVYYSTAAQTSKAVRILGYMDWGSGLATAGTWASGPTTIQAFGPGIKKPGDVVQTVSLTTATAGTTTSATFVALTTSPTLSVTPTSTPNLVRVSLFGNIANGTGGSSMFTQLARGSTQIGSIASNNTGTANVNGAAIMSALDAPGSVAAQTYQIFGKTSAGNLVLGGATVPVFFSAEEIQGAAPVIYDNDNDPRLLNKVG